MVDGAAETQVAYVPKHDDTQIDNWFTYHPPTEVQVGQYLAVRESAKELARVIVANCPSSADRSTAIRKLRECVMTANASIACQGQ